MLKNVCMEHNPIWMWNLGNFKNRKNNLKQGATEKCWILVGLIKWLINKCTREQKKKLSTDVTDATLGASVLWLGTRTGAGGTVTLTKFFLAAAHGSMDNRSNQIKNNKKNYITYVVLINNKHLFIILLEARNIVTTRYINF